MAEFGLLVFDKIEISILEKTKVKTCKNVWDQSGFIIQK